MSVKVKSKFFRDARQLRWSRRGASGVQICLRGMGVEVKVKAINF